MKQTPSSRPTRPPPAGTRAQPVTMALETPTVACNCGCGVLIPVPDQVSLLKGSTYSGLAFANRAHLERWRAQGYTACPLSSEELTA